MSKGSQFTSNRHDLNVISLLAIIGLSLLLLLPPFFRGLFFQREQQWALFFAAMLFFATWIWKISRRDLSFLRTPLDWSVLALAVMYLAALFYAVNPRLALAEVIKYSLYFLIYWLASQLTDSQGKLRFFLNVIYVSGIGLAMSGFLSAVGLIYIPDGFRGNRIYSSLQYPNALASYLSAVYFLGMGLWLEKMKSSQAGAADSAAGTDLWRKPFPYLYTMGNYILFIIYLASGSRGGLVVFIPVLLLFFIGLGKGSRMPIAAHFLAAGGSALAVNGKMVAALVEKVPQQAWLWLLLGLVAAVVAQLLIRFLFTLRISRKWLMIGAAVLLLTIAGAAWMQYGEILAQTKQTGMGRSFSIKDKNVQERFLFWQDAMEIVHEHPLLGMGGGAFEETYRRYQSNNYSSTQVHNHYIQILIETGIVGLSIFLLMWFFFIWTAWKIWRNEKNRNIRLLILSMAAAAINLGLHAFLDFDLSLSAMMIFLFALLGFCRGIQRFSGGEVQAAEVRKLIRLRFVYLGTVSLFTILVMGLMVALWQAGSHAQLASKAYKEKNFTNSRLEYQNALRRDPWNVDYLLGIAMTYQQEGDKEKAAQVMDQVLDVAPYHLVSINTGIKVFMEAGISDKVLKYSEMAVENDPFGQEGWNGYAYRFFVVGYQAWTKGDRGTAKELLAKSAAVPERIQQKIDEVPEFFRNRWGNKPPLTISPTIGLYSGAANYILHNWPQAEVQLKAAFQSSTDTKMKGEAAMWLAILAKKQGQDAGYWLEAGAPLVSNFAAKVQGMSELPPLE